MQCPYCGDDDLKVLDTTDIKEGIRRRRECQVCGRRFTTYERAVSMTPMIIKANGDREEFDPEKLKRGIWNACAKRPIPAAEIERLAAHIETSLQATGRPEVSSRVVGDFVIAGLKELDPIAYIRYAIVYMGLDNLLSVRSEIDKLLTEQQGYPSGSKPAPRPGKTRRKPGKQSLESNVIVLERPGKAAEPGQATKRSGRPRNAAKQVVASKRGQKPRTTE